MLDGDIEDDGEFRGLYQRKGRDADGNFFSYEKGKNGNLDKFEMGNLSDEEMQKWRKEIERNRPRPINEEIRTDKENNDKPEMWLL